MKCIECEAVSPDGNRYCGQCGAELRHTLEETVRRKGFRDRQATEMEITESVANRLMKWGGWLTAIAALILASFGFALRLVYSGAKTASDVGKTQIESAVSEGRDSIAAAVAKGTSDIAGVRQAAPCLRAR